MEIRVKVINITNIQIFLKYYDIDIQIWNFGEIIGLIFLCCYLGIVITIDSVNKENSLPVITKNLN